MLSTGRSIRGGQDGRGPVVVLAVVLVVVAYMSFRSGYVTAAYGYITSVQGLLPAIVGALLALLANYLLQYMRARGEQVMSKARTRTEAENAAVQTYLDRIETLLPEEPEEKLLPEALGQGRRVPLTLDLRGRQLWQARTMAILEMLSGESKRVPLKLAYELGLLNMEDPQLDLKGAALDYADLHEVALPSVYLHRVNMRRADLRGANLSAADLSGTDLRGTNLSDADLSGADLTGANLLPYDERQPAKMSARRLKDPDQLSVSEPRFTKLIAKTKLIFKMKPSLTPTNLSNTDLSDAYLSGAILANIDLRETRGLSAEQIHEAIGNKATRLPSGLEPPQTWQEPIYRQIEITDKRSEMSLRPARGPRT